MSTIKLLQLARHHAYKHWITCECSKYTLDEDESVTFVVYGHTLCL